VREAIVVTTPLAGRTRASPGGETLIGRVSWLEVGGRRFTGPPVTVDPPGDDDPLFDGTTGCGVLRDFVVVFSDPERKIAFLDR